MKIAILGRGQVGQTLGSAWSASHDVVFGSRTPNSDGERSMSEAASWADVVVLTTPSSAVTAEFIGSLPLSGKIVVDATNPIKADFSGVDPDGPNVGALAPDARVVKAFNSIGVDLMANPRFPDGNAALLVASDDEEAKATVIALGEEIGFEGVDAGGWSAFRNLENAAWLWISLSMKHGRGIGFKFMTR
ncbi:MAG: NAD(P)-binding domain-containing protein [Armatimonadetes bacterium]|nr:NAD(P)-binding domain-containing protein [Armatimonadota bacterium]